MKNCISIFCRAEIRPEFQEWINNTITQPGVHPIPESVIAPRQIRLREHKEPIPAQLKWHRDAYVPTINRATSLELARQGIGTYEPQALLVYSLANYLADNDVNEEERARVTATGADLVIVAVIGESRNTLSVCRNIVSECQDPATLQSDAKAAIKASQVFLIED